MRSANATSVLTTSQLCVPYPITFNFPFQVAKEGPEAVSIKDILLEMRTYRMGLIQVRNKLSAIVVPNSAYFYIVLQMDQEPIQ